MLALRVGLAALRILQFPVLTIARIKMIQLSVIVVTWNCRQFIRPFLESFGNLLSDPSVQILVVDNASHDGTAELIEQEFRTVELVRNKTNLGFSRGNNIGLSLAKGEFVALINPDVRLLPGCLNRMMEWMRKHEDTGLLGPQMLGEDGLVHRSTMRFPTAWNCLCDALALNTIFPKWKFLRSYLAYGFSHDETREVDVLNGWFWMTRKSALDQVGFLDERFFMYGEDIDWCKGYHAAGWKRVYLAGAAAIHYGGGSSANAPIRFYIEQHRAMSLYFKKHHNLLNQFGFMGSLWIYHLARIFGHGLRSLFSNPSNEQRVFKIKRSVACLRWLLGIKPSTQF